MTGMLSLAGESRGVAGNYGFSILLSAVVDRNKRIAMNDNITVRTRDWIRITSLVHIVALLWSSRVAQSIEPQIVVEGGENVLGTTAFSPDGEKLLTRWGSAVRVWFLEEGTYREYTGIATAKAWSADSTSIIRGFDIGAVSIIDITTDTPNSRDYVIPFSDGRLDRRVTSVALSPDMGRIAAYSGSLYLLDARSGELIDRFTGGINLSFLPDGIRIFYESVTGVHVIDTITKQLTLSTGAASGSVTPEGNLLVTYAGQTVEQRTALLNPVTGEEVVAYPSTEGKRGFSAAPYENKLVRLEQDGNAVKVERWNRDGVIEDEAILTYDYPTPVRFTALSPDSRQMVTVTTDGIYLWNINQIATPVRDARVYGPE